MSKELVISTNRHETKVAILEDDQLVEVYFQRSNEYSLAGSVHKGRVTRVLPGMQSAFVDLGLERDTFLYVSDFFEENEDFDRLDSGPAEKAIVPQRIDRPERTERGGRGDRGERPDRPARSEALERAHGPERGERVERAEGPRVVPAMEPPARAAEASSEAAPPAEAVDAAPQGEGDRDQRGRRSRRRRRGVRGFPDSKYASPGETREEPAAVQAPAEPESEEDVPILLPGESLRKYRGPGHAGEQRPPRRAASFEAEPATDLLNGSDELPADIAALPNDNPEEQPPANALPDAPAHEQITAHGAAPALESVPHPDHKAGLDPEPPLYDPADGIQSSAEEVVSRDAIPADQEGEEEGQQIASVDDEDEGEIQALILEAEIDGVDEIDPVSSGDESEPLTEDAAALEGEAPTDGEAPAGGDHAATSASVREQGGRYLQRSGRRMRRRTRGGPQTGEPSQPPRPERAPERQEGVRQETEPREGDRREHRPASRPERAPVPSISELLKEGQEIIVQIAKEPLGQKGARITSHIALPGRYVVYMPTLDHTGVSRKIASDEERLRLKRILQKHKVGVPGGYIIRTAGEGKPEDEIAADMTFLANLWLDIRQKAEKRPAPILLHHDLDIVQRILRDQVNDGFKSIWVDNEEMYESILRFLQRFQPTMVSRVKLYTRPAPVFDAFSVTTELEKALRPKVWLKSGGYIVINQTEALVAIDINTGKYVGKSNRLEDTIVKTNTEAVKEIVRQIRLRDLGGIIVIDFIDMDERRNRARVMQVLEDAMRSDRAPYKILQFNDFGLVAITRKRVKQSLERTLCAPCPYCEGAGYVKSVQTVIGEILQEAQKIAKAVEGNNVVLRVHPDVAKVLKSHQNHFLEEVEEILKRPVLVTGDATLHHEKFDLA